ncbi:MAG TPA: type I methionyl aminopeptidase [Candidatus Paceibacterota bacterium]
MIKQEAEIKIMKIAGRIAAKVMQSLSVAAEEGITLAELDYLASELIKKAGAKAAFLGYRPAGAEKPYPATICASLNEVVVHGVPNKRRLQSGDILKIDLGVKYEGYYSDTAVTFAIGSISKRALELIEITREALSKAISLAKPGATLGDLGHAIKATAERAKFKVVKGLTGHGIGKNLHEDPEVFNEGVRGRGLKLKAGMTLAIEPMFSAGSERVKKLADDSYATVDGSISAHFEHTIAITDKGAEVLTVL